MDEPRVRDLYVHKKSDFLRAISQDLPVKDCEHVWDVYKSSAQQLLSVLASYRSAGATVKTHFSHDDLATINQYDAVIIIAHHVQDSDSIEFSDGPIPTSKIVEIIPSDYSGVLDISSCYSSTFQLEIKMRAPSCHIIATNTETSLRVRTIIYERLLDYLKRNSSDYLIAFRDVVNNLYETAKEDNGKTSSINLGGKQRSTIYAPVEVCRGETFIVQLFLHKDEESEDIEFQAQMVDDSAKVRGSKPLSIKLKKGDKVDVLLQIQNASKEEFAILKPHRRSVEWQNEPISVEFAVSVSKHCAQTAFIGNIMLAVNKIPIGSMLFRTKISESNHSEGCAVFETITYDKASEMRDTKNELQNRMRRYLELLDNEAGDNTSKDICERCLKLLSDDLSHEKNNVPRVFISSTSDMAPYRKVVEERVKACEMFPDMYELWGQGNEYPRDMCCKHVLQSDFFVCLLGPKYGYIEPIWDKSMTEIEYRVAKSAGIPVLVYILNDGKDADIRQKEFMNEIRAQRMVGIFRDAMSLAIMANSELITLKTTQK